jgi:hypothetical protein
MGVINIARVVELVEQAEEAALETTAAWIVKDARARAPVRKVFKEPKGFKRKFRSLTPQERNLAIKRALAYKGYTDLQRRRSVAFIRNYARAEVPRRGSNNAEAKRNQHGRWFRASRTPWCSRPNCRVGHAGERTATAEKGNWTGVLF